MRATITCTACGTVLGIPKNGVPKDGLSCNWCGYVNTVEPEPAPKAVAATAPSPSPPPLPVAKQAPEPAETPKAAPHRWADDEDDNGQPYALPHEEVKTRPCDSCGKKIALKDVVCVHCGHDAKSGEKVERTFQPVDREWQSGWPKERRIQCLLAFQAINLLTILVSLSGGGSLPTSILTILFYIALQAFIFGTYDSVRIRRNKKGQAEITITWRVAFVPQPPQKVNWRDNEGVAFGHYDASSMMDWVMVVVLLPFFIIPAILWWYYVIRSDRFFAALARDHGYPDVYLYRGMDELKAKEIAQIATDATALPLVTKL
jgi:hypothetical protein